MKKTTLITNDWVYENARNRAVNEDVAPEFRSALKILHDFWENPAIRKVVRKYKRYDLTPQVVKDYIIDRVFNHYNTEMENNQNLDEAEQRLLLNQIVIDHEFLERMAMNIVASGHLAFAMADVPIMFTRDAGIKKFGKQQYDNAIEKLRTVGLEVETK